MLAHMSEIWNILGAVGSLIGGVGGVIGCFALVQTRTSNELAQDADAVSKEGVALAGTAKEIAAEANQKADKANEISERALAVGSDQTVYHWRCAYDGDAGKVVVVNESPNKATDVTVVFRFQDVTLADARQDVVAGFGELALDAPLVADYLARDAPNSGAPRPEG